MQYDTKLMKENVFRGPTYKKHFFCLNLRPYFLLNIEFLELIDQMEIFLQGEV